MTDVPGSQAGGDAGRARSSERHLQAEGFGPDTEGLIAGLGSKDLAVRSEAAFVLGYRGDHAALPALREALTDPDARVRVEAALAVARLGEREAAMPVLVTELGGQFFADAPLRAARALALLGDPGGFPRVLEALDSPLASNRREALAVAPAFLPYVGQMVQGQPVDAVAVLLRGTRDVEPILQRDARDALATIDDPRAAAELAEHEKASPKA